MVVHKTKGKYNVSALKCPSYHAYIHNRSLQSFSQDYNLVAHNGHIVCVNFIREWWDLQFKVDSKRHNNDIIGLSKN